jgi:low temperature requirement protein LtrA
MHTSSAEPGHPGAFERHATNLELFLDLVFVFAVTQLASLIASDLTAAGIGRAVVIAALVWWQWSQYTWAGTVIDLERSTVDRVMVLCSIPAALLMTIAIPGSFGDTGWWFAFAYLGVQLWVIAMQGRTAWSDPNHRASWVRYASAAVVAPIMVLIGAAFDGGARTAWWTAAALVSAFSGLMAGSKRRDQVTEWRINPTHFAERHALFVIISLGEALVAIGTTATRIVDEQGFHGELALAVVCCVAVAAVMWWVYFNWIPRVGEHALASVTGGARARLARDIFTYFHFPLVLGVVFFAVSAKHVVEHPSDPLDIADRWLLAGSTLLFVGALLLTQFRVARWLAPERLVAIGVVAGIAFGLHMLSGTIVMVLVAVTLAVMQSITWRRFRSSDLAAQIFDR